MRMIFVGLTLAISLTAIAAPVEFIAFGDAPYYNPPEDVSMFKKLVDQVNVERPDFAVHVGDFRGGGADCSDETYRIVIGHLNLIESPVIYTPGDNDWTDCHAAQRDPLQALRSLRAMFFADDFSLGKTKMRLESQGARGQLTQYVENRRWKIGEVAFFTLHVVGSRNNHPFKNEEGTEYGNVTEFNDRMAANLAWIDSSFSWARQNGSKALVMIFHADMLYYKARSERPGHDAIIQRLRQKLPTFSGEVLAVQGDSHRFVVDQPINEMQPWEFEWPIKNFTRLQVYGAPDVRGVKVVVDTGKAQPFSFEPLPRIDWEYPLPEKR